VYPWAKGLNVDNIMAYYDEVGTRTWTHAETGAPVLKAQHPEFEMYNQGVHARSGVACADCHMPYQREGAMKISDHHVRSPVLNINTRARPVTSGRKRSCAHGSRRSRAASSACATGRWKRSSP
jgi:nitrite reductase (cytochrome c-552)